MDAQNDNSACVTNSRSPRTPSLIGIVLSQAADGNLVVEEMKEGLLAKSSGLISVGDTVLSINDRVLARIGTPTLTNALDEMRAAPRPVRILFQRARS
jgi:C-terminal processing protease CtpA/Prc